MLAHHVVGTACNIPTTPSAQTVWRSINLTITTHQFNFHYFIFKNVLDLWIVNTICMLLTLLIMCVWSTSVISVNVYHICGCYTSCYVFFCPIQHVHMDIFFRHDKCFHSNYETHSSSVSSRPT
jgi:hypothetical protein